MHILGRLALAAHALPAAALAAPGAAAPLVGAWLAVEGAVMAELLRPGSRSFAPNLRHGDRGGPEIALSFDDGPDGDATLRLLDRLEAGGVTAAFFFVGGRARSHPEAVRRAAAAGHLIGNHPDTHPAAWALASRRRVFAEIGDAQAALADLTGRPVRHFRPPIGHKNFHMKEALEAHDLRQVTWSLRSYDTLLRDGARVVRRVTRKARGGDLILLHERLVDARGEALAPALVGPLLDGLIRRGLRPVSLPDLLPDRPQARPARGPAGRSAEGSVEPRR